MWRLFNELTNYNISIAIKIQKANERSWRLLNSISQLPPSKCSFYEFLRSHKKYRSRLAYRYVCMCAYWCRFLSTFIAPPMEPNYHVKLSRRDPRSKGLRFFENALLVEEILVNLHSFQFRNQLLLLSVAPLYCSSLDLLWTADTHTHIFYSKLGSIAEQHCSWSAR